MSCLEAKLLKLEKAELISNSITTINISLVILAITIPIMYICKSVFVAIWGYELYAFGILLVFDNLLISILTLFASIVIHEITHGVVFARYCCQKTRAVKYGFKWKFLTPYAHCNEPLLVSQYRLAVIMPLIVQGLLPLIVSIIVGSSVVMLYGIVFTIASGGDIAILYYLKKYKSTDYVLDSAKEVGFTIYKIN